MAKYQMLRVGDRLTEYTGSQEADDLNAIAKLDEMLPGSVVKLEEYECDCQERFDSQETFTKLELVRIHRCPVNHTITL